MWIEFAFDPHPSNKVEGAIEFIKLYSSEYPTLEISEEEELQFKQVSPTKLPEIVGRKKGINHIRARGVNGDRWLQMTSTKLVCSFLRLGEQYPGFACLSEDAMGKLKQYMERCKPTRLRSAAIHYVDVIEVPAKDEIFLRDYFVLGVDLPKEPWGNAVSFLTKMAVEPPDKTGPLEIQLQFEQAASGGDFFRFRMDWHKSCPYDESIAFDGILDRLNTAHASVMTCFRAAFTEAGWNLFQPS